MSFIITIPARSVAAKSAVSPTFPKEDAVEDAQTHRDSEQDARKRQTETNKKQKPKKDVLFQDETAVSTECVKCCKTHRHTRQCRKTSGAGSKLKDDKKDTSKKKTAENVRAEGHVGTQAVLKVMVDSHKSLEKMSVDVNNDARTPLGPHTTNGEIKRSSARKGRKCVAGVDTEVINAAKILILLRKNWEAKIRADLNFVNANPISFSRTRSEGGDADSE